MLALGADAVGREFRGAMQTGAFRYLARADGAPFGYVDCGTFVAPGSDGLTGSIAFAVDPQARGRGLGRAMLAALVSTPELASVAVFEARRRPGERRVAALLGGGTVRAHLRRARRRGAAVLPPASPLNGLIPVGFQGICTLHGV